MLKVFGWIVFIIVTIVLINQAFWAINQPNDILMFGGLFGLIAIVLLWTSIIGRYMIRKGFGFPVLLLAMAVLAGGCTRIPPGYSGIVVNSWGEDRGVDSYPLVTGRVVYNPWTTDVLTYPHFMQTGKWADETRVTCNDKDGLSVGLNIGFGYQIEAQKIPAFYVKHRIEDLQAFSNGFLRTEAQGAFNVECPKYTAEQIYGAGKEPLLAAVKAVVNTKMISEGLNISQFSTVDEVLLPQEIKDAITRKIQAIQKAQQTEFELRDTEAQVKKVVAAAEGEAQSAIAKARGQSEANKLLTQSLTPQLLDWRRLTIQENATNKWNGGLPGTMLGESVPFIQVK